MSFSWAIKELQSRAIRGNGSILWGLCFLQLAAPCLLAQKFYPDDPLQKEPAPRHIEDINLRRLNEYVDFFASIFGELGERHPENGFIPAQGVNTLGEVPDGPWYVNRHGRRRMTLAELTRGTGNDEPPSKEGVWKVVAAKVQGVTPGFEIKDVKGRRYVVKFDPMSNLGLASAADVVGSKFFHALGYHVPENYVIYFDRDRITVAAKTSFIASSGKRREMQERDLDEILVRVPRDPQKGYRGLASLYLSGKPAGPFEYYGTRKDDPNDIVAHEHRRELRGLFVFAAWLGHNDIKSLNSLDMLVEENGLGRLRHYLIDFGSALGSDSFVAKSPRAGYEYLFDWTPALRNIFTLGVYVPAWARAHYPNFPSVGNFEYEVFEPEAWKPNYPIPAFENGLPDDTFWAAKQVMRFTDDEIGALVATGQYSNPDAAAWMVRCLIERRNKIGRAYFAKVLPLDGFEIVDQQLQFQDLEILYRFRASRDYRAQWFVFENASGKQTPIAGASTMMLPQSELPVEAGTYVAIRITGEEPSKTVTVFLRNNGSGFEIVGIDRTW